MARFFWDNTTVEEAFSIQEIYDFFRLVSDLNFVSYSIIKRYN